MTDIKTILDYWAAYSEYDPNRKQFNLMSYQYEYHEASKIMEILLKDYDSTGALSIIKAKATFEQAMKGIKAAVWDILCNPGFLEEEKEMYKLFQDETVVEAENLLFSKVNEIYLMASGKKLIGEQHAEDAKQLLLTCTDHVVKEIHRCKEDIYRLGGKLQPIKNISMKVNVFETLAQCLLQMERNPDGLYTCYINAGGSADSYFGFFIANNGNLLSINDRVDECYQGQHLNSRNARWTDEKKENVFPYSLITFSQHDYKGYATRYLIDDNRLMFSTLKENELYPLIVAIALICSKYTGTTLTGPIKYVDSLLPSNTGLLEQEAYALIKVKEDGLVAYHRDILPLFDSQKVLKGEYTEAYAYQKERPSDECGLFSNDNQFMIDLWGEGFVYNPADLMKSQSGDILALTDKENHDQIPAELVGTKERLSVQAYYQIRKHLAAYMRNKIHDEWVHIGGCDAVFQWYRNALQSNNEQLLRTAVESYVMFNNDSINPPDKRGLLKRDRYDLCIIENSYYPNEWNVIILNASNSNGHYICPITRKESNVFFTFSPNTWENIEELTGTEAPKLLLGWKKAGRSCGNHLLNITDAAAEVGTPFDDRAAVALYPEYQYSYTSSFKFSIGLSKSGLNRLIKEAGYKKNRLTGIYEKN